MTLDAMFFLYFKLVIKYPKRQNKIVSLSTTIVIINYYYIISIDSHSVS